MLVRLIVYGRYLSGMHAPAEPPGVADHAGIAARPAEYEAATLRWLQQTVQHIMCATDRLYALWGSKTGHRLLICGFACCVGGPAGSIAGL
jgi:hypothetical protein